MKLRGELEKILPSSRVLTSELELIAWAGDASFYRLIPKAVVFPETVDEIVALFALSRDLNISLTFRAAGTSLSGQAVGEGILVCVSRGWRNCEVLDEGRKVRFGPGLIAERANAKLRRFGRKIGPDPASIDSCMMGGVLANNSSGMCCGTKDNAYQTLRGLRIVLPSGLVVDTRTPDAHEKFAKEASSIHAELIKIRDEVRSDPKLVEKIRNKYRIKNTMGYSLNAFLDQSDPVEILAHLMIGSEGTLGFIAEAELETIPLSRFKATALVEFSSLEEACARVSGFAELGAQAIELMDDRALRGRAPAALLVEFGFGTERERGLEQARLERELGLRLVCAPEEQEKLWKIRKGALPYVGAGRAPGTAVLIEDVAVPAESLAACVRELRGILDRHGYAEGAVFGHAKDGNLHFVVSQNFETKERVDQYARLMEDVVACVIGKFGGSLKAEHGTGRNMAPFVELEWGREAYSIMSRIKQVIDPKGILNPGVLLNDDPHVHLKNIKTLPQIDEETDQCMECGFCEPKCPSRELTLSPRQRIAVRREIARSDSGRRKLEKEFVYAGLDTCAADGICATVCPVEIDTGALVKRLRATRRSIFSRAVARLILNSLKWVEFLLPWMRLKSERRLSSPDVIYFPTCANRWMNGQVSANARAVLGRAGKVMRIPADARGQCCGLAFGSKGFPEEAVIASERLIQKFWDWSEQGRIPILIDSSPCALSMKNSLEKNGMRVHALDSIELAQEILPDLPIRKKIQNAVLHPVCSVEKMGLRRALEDVARHCAHSVIIPDSSRCCGFAGDRGFLFPELTRSATQEQSLEIAKLPECDGYSTSTTCEIAMKRATGRRYASLWKLLEEASR